MRVLVTGGAGYIGTHTVVELYEAGHTAVIIDNLANSNPESVRRVSQIVGQEIPFYQIDCADKSAVATVFDAHDIKAVIHFAGLKSVSESVADPLKYYYANIVSSLVLLELMAERAIRTIIFSSSATVYGPPEKLPITEDCQTGAQLANPYGRTKYFIEQILQDLASANDEWNVTILRYFNPVGAHSSGLIGEDPNGTPNNLLPYISQVAVGKLSTLKVTGNDYDTPDGTGVRDYIHVQDLASGHVAALENIGNHKRSKRTNIYNLGTGRGVSVLQAIKAFEQASGKYIPYEFVARRPGDIASCYADCTKAKNELSWEAHRSFEDACIDAWRWQSNNPHGYSSKTVD